MYNTYNATSTARKLPKRESRTPKVVRISNLKSDAKAIREYLKFFEKFPNATVWQIRKHLEENDVWMSLLDNRINDCEHIIALNALAAVDAKSVQKAHDLLSDALGTRIQLKRHRQECLYRMNNTSQPFDGPREYRVRTLQEEFGKTVIIEDNRVVFHF